MCKHIHIIVIMHFIALQSVSMYHPGVDIGQIIHVLFEFVDVNYLIYSYLDFFYSHSVTLLNFPAMLTLHNLFPV